jgi:putative ABC transport system permease protein
MAHMRLEALAEGAYLAIDQLRANKTRSFLTILGIVVGVATTMAMSAIIGGIRSSVLSDIEAAGPKNFMVGRFNWNDIRLVNHDGPPWGDNPEITPQEAQRLSRLPNVKEAIPGVDASGTFVNGRERVEGVQIAGRGAGWSRFANADIPLGHDFLPTDVAAAHPVVVVSAELAESLFGVLDPIGRQVRIRGHLFTVIGVLDLPTNVFAAAMKNFAVVPYTAALKYLDADREMLAVFAVPATGVQQDAAIDQVIAAMRTIRGLRPGDPNNFAVIKQEEMVKTFNRITGIFFVVMIALSSVALLVGGVGVIAIMMIAVTERTREIGIRKALGATRREILWQFLIEAATVTVIGSAIGMLLGGSGAFLVAALTPVPAKVPFFAVVGALLMAVVSGVLFGLWPAWRASRLDPVVALRYE